MRRGRRDARRGALLLTVGAFRLPATQPFMPVAGPPHDLKNDRNRNQHEDEVYERHYRYFGRMVLYPFSPSQQSRYWHRDKESPLRAQPSPEALARSATDVPK